ncbi:MAG: DMT family transporter [Synergistaceae bacterium]|nr:DMT family transporter [Synergistaceae bacterium]
MNKLEANVLLLMISIFDAIQYVFLSYVPEDVSHFAFLCMTNLVGFIMTLAFFFEELFRLDAKQVLQSLVLAAELMVFDIFMLLGSSGVDPTMTAAVISSYFLFIVIISVAFLGQSVEKSSIVGIIIVFIGLFFILDMDITGLWDRHILYLVIADIAFATYTITVGYYASASNPSILSMGHNLFCFLFTLILWVGESWFYKMPFTLPSERQFWGIVIYIGFFIRGLYTVIQIYAQRYVSALNTSLVLSSGIVITMAVSPVLSALFSTEPEVITPYKIIGSVIMVAGLLTTEPEFVSTVRKMFHAGKKVSR